MEVNTLNLILSIEKVLKRRDAEKIRGYLGNVFWENPFAHHHTPDGRLLYKYPRIQYKIFKGNAIIVSFDEGNEILLKVFNDIKKLEIEGDWQQILCKELTLRRETFDFSDEPIDYLFLTPWLALNQENYAKYRNYRRSADKKWLLQKILVANILSVAKNLNFTANKPIVADILYFRTIPVNFKDHKLLGFYCIFRTNFLIPNLWGIGKSVARGFGTIFQKNKFNDFIKDFKNHIHLYDF